MDTPSSTESRDGTGAGDRDREYAWGQPQSYLTIMAQSRLLIMRGYIMDFRRGEHGGAADGDLGYTEETPAGVIVPTPQPIALPPAPIEDVDYGG